MTRRPSRSACRAGLGRALVPLLPHLLLVLAVRRPHRPAPAAGEAVSATLLTGPETAVLDAAAELAVDLRARADETDRLRTVPADLIARAKAAGLCRLALPASLGGLELDPLTFLSVAERPRRPTARRAGRSSSATARPSSPGSTPTSPATSWPTTWPWPARASSRLAARRCRRAGPADDHGSLALQQRLRPRRVEPGRRHGHGR